MLGLHCCVGFSPAEAGRSSSLVVGHRLLAALLLQSMGSRKQAQPSGLTGLGAPRHVGASQIRDRIHVSCTGRRILYHWASREALHFSTEFTCLSLSQQVCCYKCDTLYWRAPALSRGPASPLASPPHLSPLGCPWDLSPMSQLHFRNRSQRERLDSFISPYPSHACPGSELIRSWHRYAFRSIHCFSDTWKLLSNPTLPIQFCHLPNWHSGFHVLLHFRVSDLVEISKCHLQLSLKFRNTIKKVSILFVHTHRVTTRIFNILLHHKIWTHKHTHTPYIHHYSTNCLKELLPNHLEWIFPLFTYFLCSHSLTTSLHPSYFF